MSHFFQKLLCWLVFPLYASATQIVFTSPPENFHPKVEVAACFIKVGDQFLFLKGISHKAHGETWGIPGGKCEIGETAQETVIREVQEETGLVLQSEKIRNCKTVYFRHPTIDFTYHMFEYSLENFPKIQIRKDEHLEFRFLTLEEALHTLPLIPGEAECIELVYGIKP